jgi:hypothetical protein
VRLTTETTRREAIHEAGHATAAILYGIPIIAVTITGDRPHLHRGDYRPARSIDGLARIVTLCCSGPAAEEYFCGSVLDGCIVTDLRMARGYLAQRLVPDQVETQLAHCRDMAARLVRSRWGRWHIKRIASALLACGTLDGERVDIVVGRSQRGFKSAYAIPTAW